jgi:ADP-ribose pyrophosphatase
MERQASDLPQNERVEARGRFLDFVIRDGWEFADRRGITGIVGVVAVTPEGRLLLVEQYRPPVRVPVLELPAGLVGDGPEEEAESLVEGARRELLEETGYDATHWTAVARGCTSPGTTSEIMTLFLATGVTRVGPGGGSNGESIRVHAVALEEADVWLAGREAEGILIDLKVYSGLHFARLTRAEHAEHDGTQPDLQDA